MYVVCENEGNNNLDLRDIIKVLTKRIKFLIAFPIVFSMIGLIVSIWFINPVYEAATTIIVWQNNDSSQTLNQSDVNLSKSLIYTYAEIIKSDTVINNAKQVLNINKLEKKTIFVSPVEDTQILKIKVQNKDAELSYNIANAIVEQFAHEIVRITSTDNVAVIDFAKLPEKPVKPNIFFNTFISGMLGEMIILLIVFLLEYFDNTIKTEKDIELFLRLPLLGTLPNYNKGEKETYEYGKVYSER